MTIFSKADSYKYCHFNLYPPKTEQVMMYMEARKDTYAEIPFLGLRDAINELEHLMNFTMASNIDNVEEELLAHGLPCNKQGFIDLSCHYAEHHILPLSIFSVSEGSINAPGDVLMTITNTDPRFFWLPSFLETYLMKLWYPCTVAAKSRHVKKIIKSYYDKTSDNPGGIEFAYHNFGDRGSSSVESAKIGGLAHLTQFSGTDNFDAVYNLGGYGYSIPATEHSVVTSWGRENEFSFYEHFLETYKSSPMIACVMDSYDIYKALEFITSGTMKERIESTDYPIWVIRPDSGNPLEVIQNILDILDHYSVNCTVNSKGYLVFDKYRIIWGDGITPETIENILEMVEDSGYSAENIAFGSGGDLMQNVNRDTCGFAMKCCAVKVDGEWRDVYKDPITDPGKTSKRGLVTNPRMEMIYNNGWTEENQDFDEIRKRGML